MENYLSKDFGHSELQGNNSDAIEIIKHIYKVILLTKERPTAVVYSNRDQ